MRNIQAGSDCVGSIRSLLMIGAAGAAIGLSATSARAQESGSANARATPTSGPTTSQDQSSGGIEEIIVTATRRSTALQQTPIAVTALSGTDIQEKRIQTADDLVALVPNMHLAPVGAQGGHPSLRGEIGTDYSPGVDQPVAVFIDDIFFGDGTEYINDLFDVNQVEVLRGPQGTTFGRNVTGGAFVISTKAPKFAEEVALSLTARSNPGMEASGYLNTVLVPNQLAARISFDTKKADGTILNHANGDKEGGVDVTSLRAQLLWQPDDNTKVRASITYSKDASPAPAYQWFVGTVNPTLTDHFSANPNQTYDPSPLTTDLTSTFGFVNIEHDFSQATLTSVSTYREADGSDHVGTTPTPVFLAHFGNHDDQFSQELRLTSPPTDDGLEWIGGLYYLHLHTSELLDNLFSMIPGSVLFAAQAPGHSIVQQSIKLDSVAPYAEGVYHFSPQIALRLGARYTLEDKSGETIHSGVIGLPVNPDYDITYSKQFGAFTPRAILEYRPTKNAFLYGGASRGFKGGGWSASTLSPTLAEVPLRPETVTSYEAGVKTTWLNNLLLANVTIFRANTKDLQERVIDLVTNAYTVANAASARAQGAEAELGYNPITGLTLLANYGYLDSKFLSFPGCSPGVNCSGNQVPWSPKHTLSLSASYTHPLNNGSSLFGNFSGQYASRIELDPNNRLYSRDLIDMTAVKGVFNLSLGWNSPTQKWQVSAWSKNITDKRAVTSASPFTPFVLTHAEFVTPGAEVDRIIYNQARTFGVTVNCHIQ